MWRSGAMCVRFEASVCATNRSFEGFLQEFQRGVHGGIHGSVHPIDEAGSRNGVYDFQLMWACQGSRRLAFSFQHFFFLLSRDRWKSPSLHLLVYNTFWIISAFVSVSHPYQ